MKWHQLLVNQKEIQLYHELRKIEQDGNVALDEDDDHKLYAMIYIRIQCGT